MTTTVTVYHAEQYINGIPVDNETSFDWMRAALISGLILVVLLKEGFGLLEFYTEHMSRIKGIQSVETFVVYKDYNFTVPYIL